MLKIVIPTLVIGTLIVASNWYMKANADYEALSFNIEDTVKVAEINNFKDCAEAGNPIMESYPEQCQTKDGRVFVNVNLDQPASSEINEKRAPITDEEWSDQGKVSAMAAVRLAAAKDLSLPEAIFEIVSMTEEVWPNGCLGLGTADEMCMMMLVPGYEITLVANGEKTVYRTDEAGTIVKKDAQLAV